MAALRGYLYSLIQLAKVTVYMSPHLFVMGGTRIYELGDSEGARWRAWGQKKIVFIRLSTDEN